MSSCGFPFFGHLLIDEGIETAALKIREDSTRL